MVLCFHHQDIGSELGLAFFNGLAKQFFALSLSRPTSQILLILVSKYHTSIHRSRLQVLERISTMILVTTYHTERTNFTEVSVFGRGRWRESLVPCSTFKPPTAEIVPSCLFLLNLYAVTAAKFTRPFRDGINSSLKFSFVRKH